MSATDSRSDARLSFRLPEITRYAWVSDAARSMWEPRFEGIKAAWAHVELASVAGHQRPACVRLVHPGALHGSQPDPALGGLELAPIGAVAMSDSPYFASVASPVEGQPYAMQVAVASTVQDATALAEAWRHGDQARIGKLLGYPRCCADFFDRTWVQEGWLDTTWPMTLGSTSDGADPNLDEFERQVAGPAGCNILLRWLGLRAVPHLPCSFDCVTTNQFAQSLRLVANDEGFGAEFDLLHQILGWPVEWSALHGVAIVKTPVVTITTTTDATAGRIRVRRSGDGKLPEHAARGLRFPFSEPPPARRRIHVEALSVVNE